jgi:hypothetical protein
MYFFSASYLRPGGCERLSRGVEGRDGRDVLVPPLWDSVELERGAELHCEARGEDVVVCATERDERDGGLGARGGRPGRAAAEQGQSVGRTRIERGGGDEDSLGSGKPCIRRSWAVYVCSSRKESRVRPRTSSSTTSRLEQAAKCATHVRVRCCGPRASLLLPWTVHSQTLNYSFFEAGAHMAGHQWSLRGNKAGADTATAKRCDWERLSVCRGRVASKHVSKRLTRRDRMSIAFVLDWTRCEVDSHHTA